MDSNGRLWIKPTQVDLGGDFMKGFLKEVA